MSNETERLDLYMSRIIAGLVSEPGASREVPVDISDWALRLAKAAMQAVDDSIAADKQATLDAARADVVANVAAVMGDVRPPVGTVAKGKDLDLRVGDVVSANGSNYACEITAIDDLGRARSGVWVTHNNLYGLISRADEATKEQGNAAPVRDLDFKVREVVSVGGCRFEISSVDREEEFGKCGVIGNDTYTLTIQARKIRTEQAHD